MSKKKTKDEGNAYSMNMNVLWFSCGVSSAIAAWLCKDELDEIIYCHVDDQHEDSMRFLHDVEKLIRREITVIQANNPSVDYSCRSSKCIVIPGEMFAACTNCLKKKPRLQFEINLSYDNPELNEVTYFWGLDYDEVNRMGGFKKIRTEIPANHRFPLHEKELRKQDCHGLIARLGVRRPVMYDMGYSNNNCIGCVKGGMWYWNKIRKDFPRVFESRALMERDIGYSCIPGVFLDTLGKNMGRKSKEIDMSCMLYCEATFREKTK